MASVRFTQSNDEPGFNLSGMLRGFTLIELLAVIAILGVLAGLLFPALVQGKKSAQRIQCVNNLKQMGVASMLYWDDNDGRFFKYRRERLEAGDLYWFGLLSKGPEGSRRFDIRLGALHPYLKGKGVEICPTMNYLMDRFKLKAAGAAYGYGYNIRLSGKPTENPKSLSEVHRTSSVSLFADAAQVNAFQAPATPDNPMLEEFYYINEREPTTHFRHRNRANVVFVDGHVGSMPPENGSLDKRLPGEAIGHLPQENIVP